MYKIDLKDRKILYELDLNCRQSNSQIGKKVGLKRDIISYRLKKLQDEGIINNFWTFIDTFKLGYDVFRLYINFQYITPKIKEEIIQYFVNYRNSWVVATTKSEIDLDVVIWVKDIFEFYQFWEATLDKYEDYFSKYSISIYIQSVVYKKSYLLPEVTEKSGRIISDMHCGGKSVEIDEINYKIFENTNILEKLYLENNDKNNSKIKTVKNDISKLKEQIEKKEEIIMYIRKLM